MIKQGDIAYLKTTGEAVYVISTKIGEDGDLVTVRRPVAGQNGISHELEAFYMAELETLEDQRRRFAVEREELLSKYGPKQSPETSNFLA